MLGRGWWAHIATRGWKDILALIALVVGLLATQQIRLVARLQATTRVKEGRTLTFLVTRTLEGNQALKGEASRLRSRLHQVQSPQLVPLQSQLGQVERVAGLDVATGSGVVLTIHDATQPSYPGEPAIYELVHDQYILHIVAVLSAAGATAIAIDNQRVVSSTAIFCAGPTIRVNGINYGSPFVIQAIGPTRQLLSALNQDPDIQGWSQLVSIRAQGSRLITVPAYRLPVDFSLAKPAQ